MSNLTQGEELTDESIISRLEPVSIENIIPESEKKIYPITGVLQSEPKTPITPIERGDFLQSKAYLASKINPDQAAKREKQKRFTEIDIPTMHGDDDSLKIADEWEKDKQTSLNDWYRASEDYPGITKSIKDFNQLAIMSDDVETLAKKERTWYGLKTGWKSGDVQLRKSKLLSQEKERVRVTGQWDTKNDSVYKKLNDEAKLYERDTLNPLYNFGQMAPIAVGGIVEAVKVKGVQKALTWGASLVAQRFGVSTTAIQQAGKIIGKAGTLGAGTAAFAYTADIEGALAFGEYKDLRTRDGKRLDPKFVADVSDIVGYANGLLEVGGEYLAGQALGKAFGSTLNKIDTSRLAKFLSKNPVTAKLGEVISKNSDDFAGMSLSMALRKAGRTYIQMTRNEVLQEMGQETVTELGRSAVAGEQVELKPLTQRLGEALPEVAIKTASAVAPLAGLGAGANIVQARRIVQSKNDIDKAVEYKKALSENMEIIKESKTLQRDDVTGLDVIKTIAKEYDSDKVYWSKDEAKTTIDKIVDDYINSKEIPMTPDEALERTGLQTFYQRIQDENESNLDHIEIPIDELIKLNDQVQAETGTDFYKAIQDDVTASPSISTYRQAMEHYKNLDSEWDEIVNEQIKYNEAELKTTNEKSKIATKIRNDLIKVGERESVADVQSKLVSEIIYQESLRSGLPIDAVSEKLIPKIIKPKPFNIAQAKKNIRQQILSETEFTLINRVKKLLGGTGKIYIQAVNKSDYEDIIRRAGLSDRVTYDRQKGAVAFDKIIQQIDNDLTVNEFFEQIDKAKRWTPSEIKQEVEKRVLEEMQLSEKLQSETRGMVDISDKKSIITLFKNKNESTFLHEFSHIFLNNKFEFIKLGTAGKEYLSDWQTIAEWLDIKEDQEMLTDSQQEKFATGFEAFLRKGEAPSFQLKDIFIKVRKWMVKIYKSIIMPEDLKLLEKEGWIIEPRNNEWIKLSPAVKSVMDRMLASDVQIEEAKRMIGIDKKLADLGLSDTEIEYIEKLRDEGSDEAVTRILIRQLKELNPEFQKEAKVFRTQLYEKNKKEVEAEPVYQVINMLEDAFKQPIERIIKLMQEDENQLAGLEYYASLYGWASKEKLFQDLLMSNPKEIEIENRTDFEYDEKYQEIRNSEEFENIAIEALQNSKIIDLLAYETSVLEQLSEQAEVLKKEQKEVGKKAFEISKSMFRAESLKAREQARKYFKDKLINEISNPSVFITQERNAAVKSAQYQKDNNIAEALKWKRKQMFASALAKESVKIKNNLKKNLEYITKIAKLNNKQIVTKFKDFECATQISDILDRFGFDHTWGELYDKDAVGTLKEWQEQPHIKIFMMLDIPDYVLNENNESPSYKYITNEQFNDVVKAIKNISKLNNAFHNNVTKGEKENRLAEVFTLKTDADTFLKKMGKRVYGVSQAKNFTYMLDNVTDSILSQLENIERTLDFMGGFKGINGSWWKAFYGRITNAREEHLRLEFEADKKMKEIQEKYYTHSEMQELLGYRIFGGELLRKKFYSPELKQHIVKADLISMFWNLGNETNKARLIEGRTKEEVQPDGQIMIVPLHSEQDILDAINNHLSKKDLDFAQEVMDFINSYWEPVKDLYIDLTGFPPQKVEAIPIYTNHGKYDGGYFPLKRDFSVNVGKIEELAKDKALEEGNVIMSMSKNNHTKARAESAKYPVLLDINIPMNHIKSVIHDLAFRKPLIDLNSLMRNKTIQDTIVDYFGEKTFDKLKRITSIVANAGRSETLGFWGMKQKAFRRNVTASQMLGKITIAMQNLTNIISFSLVDKNFGFRKTIPAVLKGMPKYILGSLKYDKQLAQGAIKSAIDKQFRNPDYMNEELEFCTSRSSRMRKRFSVGSERDLIDGAKKQFGRSTPIADFAAAIIIYTDKIIAVPIWRGAYDSVKRNNGTEEQAINYADYIVRNAMGSGLPEDMALVMQEGGEFRRMFTMFASWSNNQFGLSLQLYRKTKYSDDAKNRIRNVAGLFALLVVAPAVSEFLAFRTPEEDESYLKWLAMTSLKGFSGSVVGLREMFGFYEMASRRGYGDISSPILSASKKILNVPLEIVDEDVELQSKAKYTAQAAGLLTGFPQIGINEIFYMLDVMNGDTEPTIKGFATGKKD